MSFGEISVIFFVAIIALGPTEMIQIKKKIVEIFDSIGNYKRSAKATAEITTSSNSMNFYLNKIIEYEGKYEGEYDLKILKAKYKEIINRKIQNEKNK